MDQHDVSFLVKKNNAHISGVPAIERVFNLSTAELWSRNLDTVDGCKILHHQKDGWNMLKPYEKWDVYHLSTGDSDFFHPQYPLVN